MRDNFSGAEEVLGLTTPTVEAFLGRDVVSLPRRLEISSQWSLSSRGRRHLDAGILRQPFHERPPDQNQRLEKLVMAFFIISRKLNHYFQTIPIIVLTKHPLRSIMENPKATTRISKWALG